MYKNSRKQKLLKNGVPKIINDERFKPPFEYECLSQIPHVDPLVASTVHHFDYEAVFATFDGPAPARNDGKIAEELGDFLRWMVKGNDMKIIGRRAVAVHQLLTVNSFLSAQNTYKH
jgi:hypothetical protein